MFYKQNSKSIHITPNTISSGINRYEFGQWRGQYWKNRVHDFIPQLNLEYKVNVNE